MFETHQRDFKRVFWKESIKKILVSNFDAALVGGKPQVEYMSLLGMPPDRIFTGFAVVDNNFWATRSQNVRKDQMIWRNKLDLPEKYFLTVSRMIPKKNISGLLRSYSQYVLTTQNPWYLIIAGDGPLRNELQNQVDKLNLTSLVHFLGYLSSEQVAPFYGLASAFVLASAYSEQWGLVVNEAMAAGLPVLVSNICGCVPDLVIEGVTGYSFDPKDEKQLTSLMQRFSTGEENLTRMGNASWSQVNNFTLDSFAINLIASAEIAIKHTKNRKFSVWPFPLVLP